MPLKDTSAMSSNGSSTSKELRTLGFQEHVGRYMCLCGRLTVRKATLVIAISTLLYSIFFVVICATRLRHGHTELIVHFNGSSEKNVTIGPILSAFFASALGFNVVQFITALTTFFALYKENQFFLVPKMMMQIITEVFFIAAAFIFAVVVFMKQYDFKYKVLSVFLWYQDEMHHMDEGMTTMVTLVAVGLTLLAIACAVIQGWTFSIVLGCYRMFRDKSDWAHWIEHSKDIRAGSFDPLVQLGTLQR